MGDFGLSKIKRNTLVSGGVRGTLPWMAPELLNGSSSKVSEKVTTDLQIYLHKIEFTVNLDIHVCYSKTPDPFTIYSDLVRMRNIPSLRRNSSLAVELLKLVHRLIATNQHFSTVLILFAK